MNYFLKNVSVSDVRQGSKYVMLCAIWHHLHNLNHIHLTYKVASDLGMLDGNVKRRQESVVFQGSI